jgi:renalase
MLPKIPSDVFAAQSATLSVAVIGAGLSGLVAARTLACHGLPVDVFDKGRGPGGRMATRRQGGYSFDHGAQYFTARDDRFQQCLNTWIDAGLVRPWEGRIGVANGGQITSKPSEVLRYVGVPHMSALTRHLAVGLKVHYQTRIAHIQRMDSRWRLLDDAGIDLGTYDVVLITLPPPQAVPLLAAAPDLAEQVKAITMLPCWAVMAVFDHPLPLAYDGLFMQAESLSWAARNNSKPGRDGPDHGGLDHSSLDHSSYESWVLHGSSAWSMENLEADHETVVTRLIADFFAMTGCKPVVPDFVQAHRWRYALAENPLSVGCLWDAELGLGSCGDWCQNSRVEGAFLSGMAAARRVLGPLWSDRSATVAL